MSFSARQPQAANWIPTGNSYTECSAESTHSGFHIEPFPKEGNL